MISQKEDLRLLSKHPGEEVITVSTTEFLLMLTLIISIITAIAKD